MTWPERKTQVDALKRRQAETNAELDVLFPAILDRALKEYCDMTAIPALDETHLEAICEVLGATDSGLTGSEIGRYLRECGIADHCQITPNGIGSTKHFAQCSAERAAPPIFSRL